MCGGCLNNGNGEPAKVYTAKVEGIEKDGESVIMANQQSERVCKSPGNFLLKWKSLVLNEENKKEHRLWQKKDDGGGWRERL